MKHTPPFHPIPTKNTLMSTMKPPWCCYVDRNKVRFYTLVLLNPPWFRLINTIKSPWFYILSNWVQWSLPPWFCLIKYNDVSLILPCWVQWRLPDSASSSTMTSPWFMKPLLWHSLPLFYIARCQSSIQFYCANLKLWQFLFPSRDQEINMGSCYRTERDYVVWYTSIWWLAPYTSMSQPQTVSV